MKYETGDFIVVQFGGGWGSQIAIVLGVRGEMYVVRKWRAGGQCWTGETKIEPERVRGSLQEEMTPKLRREFKKAKAAL